MAREIIPFQRGTLEDTPALRKLLAEQRERLKLATADEDTSARLRLLGSMGETWYLLGNYQEALALLGEALALARQLEDTRREIANLIRLATASQYAGDHSRAEVLFRQALDLVRTAQQTEYVDFVWQHLGKCLVEMGRLEEARACFEEALAYRRVKGDAELIASTDRALAAVRRDAHDGER